MIRIDGIRNTNFDYINLNTNIAIPSAVHSYSLAIEYMRKWFLKYFKDDFFKTIHVNGKHVLADWKRFNRPNVRQIEKPAVLIMPSVNPDFNRDNLDLMQSGLNMFLRRSFTVKDNFLSDYDNNVFIGIKLKQIEMPFTFRIRVRSRAQQLNLLDYVKAACRIGSTQGEYIDMDCHVPYELMLNVAADAGFEIEKVNEHYYIKDIVSFLKYLNSHSLLTFTYKFRAINGKPEFFIRLKHCYAHIACLDGISVDDGERQGALDANFHVEFTATLQMPAPQLFAYYSVNQHPQFGRESDNTVGLYQLVTLEPPMKNEKNWVQYMATDWIDNDLDITHINFKELLANSDIKKVIQHNVDIGISPAIFMDIVLYNGTYKIPITIDWESYDIFIRKHLTDEISHIAIYADLDYLNSTLANLENIESSRLAKTEKRS